MAGLAMTAQIISFLLQRGQCQRTESRGGQFDGGGRPPVVRSDRRWPARACRSLKSIRPEGLHVRGDSNHASRRALLQSVQEQAGQQERREMVEGECALEPVSGDVPGVPVAAGVIDQHIYPGQALEDLPGQPPYPGLGGQVRDEHVHLLSAGGADLAGGSFGAFSVPASDRKVRAQSSQPRGSRLLSANYMSKPWRPSAAC
jgi:hypothetical protein